MFCDTQYYMARIRIPHSITLPKELDDWVNSLIKTREFANITHAAERGLYLLKEKMDGA